MGSYEGNKFKLPVSWIDPSFPYPLPDQSTSMTSHNQHSDDSSSTHTDESIRVDHDESDLILSYIAKEIVGTVNDYPGRNEG